MRSNKNPWVFFVVVFFPKCSGLRFVKSARMSLTMQQSPRGTQLLKRGLSKKSFITLRFETGEQKKRRTGLWAGFPNTRDPELHTPPPSPLPGNEWVRTETLCYVLLAPGTTGISPHGRSQRWPGRSVPSPPAAAPGQAGSAGQRTGTAPLLGFTSLRAGALAGRMRRGAGGGQLRSRDSGTGRRGRARVCIRVAAVPIVWGRGPGPGGAAPEGPCPSAAHLRRL